MGVYAKVVVQLPQWGHGVAAVEAARHLSRRRVGKMSEISSAVLAALEPSAYSVLKEQRHGPNLRTSNGGKDTLDLTARNPGMPGSDD